MNQYRGYIHTLLPNTKYEFSLYAFNEYNYNIPSEYSHAVLTKPIVDSRELNFDAFATEGTTNTINSTGRFSKCSVTINYQQRR